MKASHHDSVRMSPKLHRMIRADDSHVWEAGDYLVEDFVTSMPERYQQEFGGTTARQHARIAAARGRRPIHADIFIGTNVSEPGFCVVAPDVPGLLAVISAGLMLEGFDITRADAYNRRTSSGYYEAIDLFWVRRTSPDCVAPLGDADIFAVRSTLRDLLSNGDLRQRLRQALPGTSPNVSDTRVRFRDLRGVPWLTLELESDDRPGLLAVVAAALATEGVQIVDSRIRTYGLRVHDYFNVIESDGSRIRGTRLQRIELAVLTAIDGSTPGV